MVSSVFMCGVCSVCVSGVCSCMWCVSVFLCVVSEVCLYVCVFVCSVCTLRVCLWCLSCESVCVYQSHHNSTFFKSETLSKLCRAFSIPCAWGARRNAPAACVVSVVWIQSARSPGSPLLSANPPSGFCRPHDPSVSPLTGKVPRSALRHHGRRR